MNQITRLIFVLLLLTIPKAFSQTYNYSEKEESIKVDKTDGSYYYKKVNTTRGNFKHVHEMGTLDGKRVPLIRTYKDDDEENYYFLLEEKGYKDFDGKIYKQEVYGSLRGGDDYVSIMSASDGKEIMVFTKNGVTHYRK